MTIRRKAVKQHQTIVAAHHFVFKSRDGMDICQYLDISPYNLYKLAKHDQWNRYIEFWGYRGKSLLEGEAFWKAVGTAEMKNGFRWAWRKWKKLFGVGGDA